jgi:hypothetical protein
MKTCEICRNVADVWSDDAILLIKYSRDIPGFPDDLPPIEDLTIIHKSCLEKASQAALAS